MASDDDFVRITLRIPVGLHQKLNDAAARKKSMNAEIIERLENSFIGTRTEESYISPNDEKDLASIVNGIVKEQVALASAQSAIDIIDAIRRVRNRGSEIGEDFLNDLTTYFLQRRHVLEGFQGETVKNYKQGRKPTEANDPLDPSPPRRKSDP